MEALESFEFLLGNVPQWQTRLHELATRTAQRHNEFLNLSSNNFQTPLTIRKKNTGSMESLKPVENATNVEDDRPTRASPPTPLPPLRIDPENKHLFKEVREARRKRRSASVRSSASGPGAKRNRTSMTIYYDSQIQDSFELLVRNIGSARNNLRKGKTAVRFKARMASLGMEETHMAPSGQFGLSTPEILRSRGSNFSRIQPTPFAHFEQDFEIFDRVDKNLELAQSLCEVGAHSFLRDGDCAEEIEQVKEKFSLCEQAAAEQTVKLRIEAEKERTRVLRLEKEREEARLKEQREKELQLKRLSNQPVAELPGDIPLTAADMLPPTKLQREQLAINDQPAELSGLDGLVKIGSEVVRPADEKPPILHMDAFPSIGAIEVDDDSDASSIHIDLKSFRNFRSTRRM